MAAAKLFSPGCTILHAHASPSDGIMTISSGVTSIRDMGNDINDLANMEQQWREGSIIGPRVSKAGLIDGRDPMQAPAGIFVTTQEEANAAINRYADLGYIQTKVCSSLNPALPPGMIQLSHKRGMRVSGHIPNGITAKQFVGEGADEIQHINFIFLNFLSDKVKDTRTPQRFTAVGQYGAGLDLDSKPVRHFIDLLIEHHTPSMRRSQHLKGIHGPPRGKFLQILRPSSTACPRKSSEERIQEDWLLLLPLTRPIFRRTLPC